MNNSLTTTILWIQNTPESYETVLSQNGTRLQSGTSQYINVFEELTSIDLEKYTILTQSLKRFTQDKNKFRKIEHRKTFISGHFVQTDQSNRKICYRALIIDATNKDDECALLTNEARLYRCTISEIDKAAFKKNNHNKIFAITITAFIILILIFIIFSII